MRMGLFRAGEGTITRGVDEIESDCKTDCCQGTPSLDSNPKTKYLTIRKSIKPKE